MLIKLSIDVAIDHIQIISYHTLDAQFTFDYSVHIIEIGTKKILSQSHKTKCTVSPRDLSRVIVPSNIGTYPDCSHSQMSPQMTYKPFRLICRVRSRGELAWIRTRPSRNKTRIRTSKKLDTDPNLEKNPGTELILHEKKNTFSLYTKVNIIDKLSGLIAG